MRRRRLSRRSSRRLFSKKSVPRRKNYKPTPMRGGFRI